jgi:hypothetical protein
MNTPIYPYMYEFAAPLKMLFDRAPRSFKLPGFLTDIAGARAFASPPMIQHSWNVGDTIGAFDNAQEKIIILRTVEGLSELAYLVRKLAA